MKRKDVFRLLLSLNLLGLSACQSQDVSSHIPSSDETPSVVSSSEEKESTSSTQSEERQDYSSLPYLSTSNLEKKTDWKGKWIFASKHPKNSYYAFRKKVSLDKLPSKAVLSLSADSKANVFVNGKPAVLDAPVKRGESELDTFYQDFDILSYLKQGDNILVFVVTNFGKNGNSYVSADKPGLLFDLDLGDQIISSDSSVKVTRLSSYRSETQLKGENPNHPISSFLAEPDIYFDAREDDGDFLSYGFDDSSWGDATILSTPGYKPFGDLYKSDIPAFDFGKEITEMTPEGYTLGTKLTADTKLTFDLSENQQFLPYFELTSEEAGKRITFYTDSVKTQGTNSFIDDYVTKQGKQSYQQYYWRSGARFVMEVPAGVSIDKVGYLTTGYHSKTVGSFVSDNTSLNTLWQKSDNTLHICMRDSYMDCPDRERSPYTGDAANQIAETLYALDEDGWKLAKKTYRLLPGWVKDDNLIPSRSPSMTTNEIPMQNLAFIATAYSYYLQTGDEETMKMVYPIFRNYLDVWSFNEDGSVVYRDGTFPWVDWGSGYDSMVMENAWYAYALESVLSLGKDLNVISERDRALLEERYNRIKTAFAKYEVSGGYASKEKLDDRANALAVLSGLASDSKKKEIISTLTTVKQASPYMERFVLEALCELGREDLAEERMLDRYQEMISYDYSTLWEGWSPEFIKGTRNHGWSGGPLVVLSKYFAGIKATSKGYETYRIKPYYGMNSLSSSVMTPKGLLSYSLSKDDTSYQITVNGIDGKGSLVLDSSYGSKFTLDGSEVTPEKDSDGNNVIALSKGSHTITINS